VTASRPAPAWEQAYGSAWARHHAVLRHDPGHPTDCRAMHELAIGIIDRATAAEAHEDEATVALAEVARLLEAQR